MRQGNLQISPQNYADARVVRTVTVRPPEEDEADSVVFDVIKRRWKLLFLCTLLSIAAGCFAYAKFTMPKAQTEAKMIFKALPTAGAEFEDPLQPLTIAEMVVSDDNLKNLARRNDINLSVKYLRDRFQVKASRFVKLISIKFTWNNAQESIDIVNDLMQIVSDDVILHRREYLEECQHHHENHLTKINAKIVNCRKDVLRHQKTIETLLTQTGQDGAQNTLLINQISSTQARLDDATIERKELEFKISNYRSEVMLLEEKLRNEVIEGKRSQFKLRQARLASLTPKMKKLQSDIDVFNANHADLDYTEWKSKIDLLGTELLAGFPNPLTASINIRETELARLRMELRNFESQMQTKSETIRILAERLEIDRRKLVSSSGADQVVMNQLEEAEFRLSDLQEQYNTLSRQKSELKHLAETNFRELLPHTKASWDTTEFNDGKKKVFVLAFAGTFVLLVLPIFALEHFFPSVSPAEFAAKNTGMSVVGRSTFVVERLNHHKSHHPLNSESLRLLALRIQQSVQSPGAMVLFSGLNHDSSAIPTLTYLGECLARREEKVLIIDACDRVAAKNSKRRPKKKSISESMAIVHQSQNDSSDGKKSKKRDLVPQDIPVALGLAEFLTEPNIEPKDLICPTDIPGVDIIPSGSSEFPSEAFGSRKMNDLFDVCRQEYTMILVSGPSTDHPSDLQMLSARADGILFTVPKHSQRSGNGKEVIDELQDLGAPIIGIVS